MSDSGPHGEKRAVAFRGMMKPWDETMLCNQNENSSLPVSAMHQTISSDGVLSCADLLLHPLSTCLNNTQPLRWRFPLSQIVIRNHSHLLHTEGPHDSPKLEVIFIPIPSNTCTQFHF
eukprot:2132408-Amphidinium_carterae.1